MSGRQIRTSWSHPLRVDFVEGPKLELLGRLGMTICPGVKDAGRWDRGLRLEPLAQNLGYLPITTETMRLAARFWADARRGGQHTASDESLDADVILAAQAAVLNENTDDGVVVATTNPRHLSRFVDASFLQNIAP